MAETLAKPGHNAGDPATYAQLFKSFFRIEDDKNSLRQAARIRIGELSEQQAQVKTLVKEAGFSPAGFIELVAQEKARRAEANRREKLEADVLHEVDLMTEALGPLIGTPLGDVVVEAAKVVAQGNGAELLNRLTQLETASPTPN